MLGFQSGQDDRGDDWEKGDTLEASSTGQPFQAGEKLAQYYNSSS